MISTSTFRSLWKMTNYGTITTLSSQGTNEFISTPQVKVGIHYCRPWKEMVRSLNFPSGYDNTIERMKKNLVFFRTNYMIILMLVLFLSGLFHPVSQQVFFVLLMNVLVVLHLSNRTVVICLLIFSSTMLLLTEAAWNILISLLFEAVFVTAHASLRNTDDLSLDEQVVAHTSGTPYARPWKEMFQSLNLPSGFRNTIERIKKNLDYFKINYVIILMLILCLSFLCHPVSLTVSLTLYLMIYVWLLPSVFNRSFRKVIIVLVIIGVILMSFTEDAWINTLSTLLIEAVIMAVHGSIRKTDDLFMDEELAQTAASRRF
ncbi:PRA1 family protein F2-like isoform X2 [Apium graveolens]|uniref:PRA1 family protein F2-like isoform X2 n=1 Tax=Apium graveolens TaxID=4045 RepID=UPI003D795CD4